MNIPVVIVSELSKDVEGRPTIDTLKYKNLENVSDKIIYLYRDVYKRDSNDVEVIVSKNNNGELGTIKLNFDREKREFKE